MRQFLAILATTLLVQSASAQALWRNFFTTNRDPIVEVVAGSNATVQATTVGSNLRRFTVNSTATGGGLAQTNISYVAVTNAPWQFGDSDLTNWATLNTNVLSTLGQTNISYVAVTNAPWQTGSANLTNFSLLSTNTFVNKAGDTVSGPILTTSSTSNSPSATELVTAEWVRNLFNAGADYYNTTNIDSVATNVGSSQAVYKFQSTIPISDARSYTTANFLTNGGYVGSVITTNTFSQISGAALVSAYLGFTGGVGGPTLTLHPEIYYSYDRTNWFGDWSGNDEFITYGITNGYQWAISIPVTTSTNANGFYVMRRFKVGAVTGSGTRTLTVLIGTNSASGTMNAGHVTMESPNATFGNAFLANNQVFTGSNYFTQPLTLSLATNTPSAGQVLTATSSGSAKWDYANQTNTVATLPANPVPGLTRWASDVITSRGTGDLVTYDGLNWRTRDNIVATDSVSKFMINVWESPLNIKTPLSSIWFAKEIFGVQGMMDMPFNFANSGTGSGLTTAAPNNSGSSASLSVGTGTTGSAQAYNIPFTIQSGGVYGTYINIKVNVLANNTDAYWASYGFSSTTTSNNPVSGAYFLYDAYNTNSHGITGSGTNNWIAVTAESSSYTFADTGFPVTASDITSNRLSITLTSTNCIFYTNGIPAITNTTTLPTSAQYPGIKIVRVHGTTARTVNFNSYGLHIRLPSSRQYP